MKIFMTGASGFIGKHLAKELSEKHDIICLVRESTKKQDLEFLEKLGCKLVYGDISDRKILEKKMKGVDAVFHLAGGGYVSTTFKKGYQELRKLNVESTRIVFETAAKLKIKRFVHFSSISAMGIIVEQSLDEDSECKPKTPHEVCKLETEKIAEAFKDKMLVTIIRPGIVYGPFGMNSEVLQLSKMLKKKLFIIPGNGKNIMPWVYVDDIVNATILAFEKNKNSCEKFIVVSDPEPTFNEFIESIRSNLGANVFILHIPKHFFRFSAFLFEKFGDLFGFAPLLNYTRAKSMTSNRIYDIQKINALGYKQKSNLKESMSKTIKWYKENGYI
jgi:nucleoside-diphosphate-sugar epimerase